MIEKIKHVSNPLTIIAIFAGLAEISGSGALALLDPIGKHIFIWFLMLFPPVLVLCFFVVLYLKPTALYAPSDYKNDDNFLNAVGKNQVISEVFDSISTRMEAISEEVAAVANSQAEKSDSKNIADITRIIDERFDNLRTAIESGKEIVEKVSDTKFIPSNVSWEELVDIDSGDNLFQVKTIRTKESPRDVVHRVALRRNGHVFGARLGDARLKEAVEKILGGSSGLVSEGKLDAEE